MFSSLLWRDRNLHNDVVSENTGLLTFEELCRWLKMWKMCDRFITKTSIYHEAKKKYIYETVAMCTLCRSHNSRKCTSSQVFSYCCQFCWLYYLTLMVKSQVNLMDLTILIWCSVYILNSTCGGVDTFVNKMVDWLGTLKGYEVPQTCNRLCILQSL